MISKEEVIQEQERWGNGLVFIGAAESWEESRNRARALIEDVYVLDGSLLFCPTLASETQFRPDMEGALSYFVGKNDAYAEDKGFALQPWTKVRFENAGVVVRDGLTVAMGNYFFTDTAGQEKKVEYTFGYVRGGDGKVLIQVHHSALPYAGS